MSARTRSSWRRATLAALLFSVWAWSPAWAGDPPGAAPPAAKEPGRAHSFQISFGADFLAPETIGTAAAAETNNSTGGGTTTLFTNTVSRNASAAFRARIGYHVTDVVTIEGGFLVGRGTIEDAVSGDAEQAPPVTLAGESMTQYFVDVSVVARLRRFAFASGAAVPFVEAGAGYLRQMHENSVAFDTGQIYHFGGGVTYMFSRRPGMLSGIGLRADAQVYVRHKGFTVGDSTQGVFAALGAGLVFAF